VRDCQPLRSAVAHRRAGPALPVFARAVAAWGVQPGYLTPRGPKLMQLMGAYDATYLFRTACCARAAAPTPNASTLEPTGSGELSSHPRRGRRAAAGLRRGGPLENGSGTRPLFNGIPFGKPDRAVALASVTGRSGGYPGELARQYRTAFTALARVLDEPRAIEDAGQKMQ
jgi:hypothetical protein